MDAAAEESFRSFVAARSRHLLQAAHLLTGDRHRAEDLLQTALVRTYLKWETVQDPEGYVRRTLVNAHTDWWRRRPWREQPTDALPDLGVHDEGPELRDQVLRGLATLSRRQRAVLVLRYYEGLSEAEIADVLGCSPGTVKSSASRGLAALRPVLLPEEVQP